MGNKKTTAESLAANNSLLIRKVVEKDLSEISFIYAFAVARQQTAHTEPPEPEYWKKWFHDHRQMYAAWVLLHNDNVIGFASLSPYREGRQALKKVAEISYYLHPDHQGKGAGTFFIGKILETAKDIGFKHLIAIMIQSNSRSMALLKKLGFELWGSMPGVVEFDDSFAAHCYWGKHL